MARASENDPSEASIGPLMYLKADFTVVFAAIVQLNIGKKTLKPTVGTRLKYGGSSQPDGGINQTMKEWIIII